MTTSGTGMHADCRSSYRGDPAPQLSKEVDGRFIDRSQCLYSDLLLLLLLLLLLFMSRIHKAIGTKRWS